MQNLEHVSFSKRKNSKNKDDNFNFLAEDFTNFYLFETSLNEWCENMIKTDKYKNISISKTESEVFYPSQSILVKFKIDNAVNLWKRAKICDMFYQNLFRFI
jgi:hypothetical protein